MSELKPCPCCGASAELLETPRGYRVACEDWNCGIGTIQCDWTERRAIEIWNARHSNQTKREAITELLALHKQDRSKVNSQCDTLINMSTVEKYLRGLK